MPCEFKINPVLLMTLLESSGALYVSNTNDVIITHVDKPTKPMVLRRVTRLSKKSSILLPDYLRGPASITTSLHTQQATRLSS